MIFNKPIKKAGGTSGPYSISVKGVTVGTIYNSSSHTISNLVSEAEEGTILYARYYGRPEPGTSPPEFAIAAETGQSVSYTLLYSGRASRRDVRIWQFTMPESNITVSFTSS